MVFIRGHEKSQKFLRKSSEYDSTAREKDIEELYYWYEKEVGGWYKEQGQDFWVNEVTKRTSTDERDKYYRTR